MPRIQASTVAEHVAQQEAMVFAAAVRLFTERGYGNVNMGDIAGEVGLARSSLYRYFPDKAHILARWFRVELPVQADRARAVLTGDGTPLERIGSWVTDQLDYARQPEHELIAAFGEIAPNLDEQTRAELADSHRQMMAPLNDTLADAGFVDADDRAALVGLIGALVLAAAQREARIGADPVVRAHVMRAIEGLLDNRSVASA